MIIKYIFNTASEEYDAQEHEMYKQAFSSAHALYEIQNRLRSWTKYDDYPIVNENSFFWEDLTEEEKKKYKNNKIPDIDKMVEEINEIINDNVDMEKIGY